MSWLEHYHTAEPLSSSTMPSELLDECEKECENGVSSSSSSGPGTEESGSSSNASSESKESRKKRDSKDDDESSASYYTDEETLRAPPVSHKSKYTPPGSREEAEPEEEPPKKHFKCAPADKVAKDTAKASASKDKAAEYQKRTGKNAHGDSDSSSEEWSFVPQAGYFWNKPLVMRCRGADPA